MTRTARSLNRIVLALVGLALIAGGAFAIVRATPAWLAVRDRIFRALPGVESAPWLEAGAARPTTTALWALIAAGSLAVGLALWLALTRGGGRTADALRTEDGTTIRASAVRAVLLRRLEAEPDVLGVQVQGYERRGGPVALARVQLRPAAELGRVRESVERALEGLDETIGARVPLVVHLSAGVGSGFRGERTAR